MGEMMGWRDRACGKIGRVGEVGKMFQEILKKIFGKYYLLGNRLSVSS